MTLCTAFDGHTMIAAGPLVQVAAATKAAHDAGRAVLVFRDEDARPIDLDLRGDLEAALARLPQEQPQPEPEKRGPGRPKLGVTAREVTLLPRHWDWLASQPGGASVALRKLVEAGILNAHCHTVLRARSSEGEQVAARVEDRDADGDPGGLGCTVGGGDEGFGVTGRQGGDSDGAHGCFSLVVRWGDASVVVEAAVAARRRLWPRGHSVGVVQ